MQLKVRREELSAALDVAAEIAEDSDTACYLVGGAVRDALLGRTVLDLDTAVEGDGVAFARRLGERLRVPVVQHPGFGTATVSFPAGYRLDVASTRRERYRKPGALPSVEPAPLEEDLMRRDFTVNSLAVPISRIDRRHLVDPSGGVEDLERRLLRVHHDGSFLDDPTRILRGVRFEARLRFRLEERTEELAREALSAGALASVSEGRLRRELRLVAAEERSPVARLRDLGVPTHVLGLEGASG